MERERTRTDRHPSEGALRVSGDETARARDEEVRRLAIAALRRTRAVVRALPICALVLASSGTLQAQHDHDHRHEGLHFAHPLITESPSPDTKVRFDAFSFDGDDEDELTFNFEGEYALSRSFSIEIDIPYTSLDERGEPSAHSLGEVGLGLKLANFAYEHRGILLGYGLELGLPTGDDAKGIGSDHILEIAPFLNVGYQRGGFEWVTFFEFGIPTNQEEDEEVETELELSSSLLYRFSDRLQGLLELDMESALSGEERGETVLHLSPGVKVRPIRDSAWWIGVSLGMPLSDREEFDTRALVSGFCHF